MTKAPYTIIQISIRYVAMKFPEWFYYKRTYILTAYWKMSPSKYFSWTAMHLANDAASVANILGVPDVE
jgi:hypothetical protein